MEQVKLNQEVFDLLKCNIHLNHYQLETHEPYGLSCGHDICQQALNQLYNEEEKIIKCPTCRKELYYNSKNDISKNFSLTKILEKYSSTKYKVQSIQQAEQYIDQLKNIKQSIVQENEKIKENINILEIKIKKANETMQFNEKLVKIIELYEQNERDKLYPNSYKGIQNEELVKIQNEIKLFNQETYISLKQIEQQEDINYQEKENLLPDIQFIKAANDFQKFKYNMLKYIDNKSWTQNCLINSDNWNLILELLEKNKTKNVDDCVILSFIYWKGIKVEKDVEEAKRLISTKICNEDGRALYFRYIFFDSTQQDGFVQSCLKNYIRALSDLAFNVKLSGDQIKIINFSLTLKQSLLGQSNFGFYIFEGKGITQDKLKGAILMQRAIESGLFYKIFKKKLDEFYDESQEFRDLYPNYQKWEGDYEEFDKQEIVIL